MDGLYHVHFDFGAPDVVCHACVLHKLLADEIACDLDHGDGECDHVQYSPCDCIGQVWCSLCRSEAAA